MYIYFDKNTCLYPNCFEENIKSHAISKSLSLASIAEKYHLYHFKPHRFTKDAKKPHFKKISIRKATAHEGFCKKHDDIFQPLDTKEICNTEELVLQVYRSLCVILNEEKSAAISLFELNSTEAHSKIDKESVRLFLEKTGVSALKHHLNDSAFLNAVQKKMHFLIADHIEDELIEIEKLQEYLITKMIRNEALEIPVSEMQTLTTEDMAYTLYYYKTDFKIPVSVNSIHYGKVGDRRIRTYSIVVPYENCNLIIGVVPKELLSDDILVSKINSFFSSKIRIIEYVEAVMSTCDGWYIKPSILDSMSDKKRGFFCEDVMFYNERKLFDDYDLSIFDELKHEVATLEERKYLSSVINIIPERLPYDVRYKNMMDVINKS